MGDKKPMQTHITLTPLRAWRAGIGPGETVAILFKLAPAPDPIARHGSGHLRLVDGCGGNIDDIPQHAPIVAPLPLPIRAQLFDGGDAVHFHGAAGSLGILGNDVALGLLDGDRHVFAEAVVPPVVDMPGSGLASDPAGQFALGSADADRTVEGLHKGPFTRNLAGKVAQSFLWRKPAT